MYKKMLKEAETKGLTSEKDMWDSIDDLEEILLEIEAIDPKMYWKFIRKSHGRIYKGHYTEEFAMHDVKHLKYTDKGGNKREGAYWTAEQIEEATKNYPFPPGVNKWDKYVAGNVAHSDYCKKFDDMQILEIMFLTYFADEDWDKSGGSPTKIWEYMCFKYNK